MKHDTYTRRYRYRLFLYFFLLLSGYTASGQVGTSFENAVANINNYLDVVVVAHDLSNNAGQTHPNGLPSATELGYQARWVPTRTANVGFSDGDLMGVVDRTASGGNLGNISVTPGAQQGDHVYVMEDTDGNAIVEFSSVDLTGTTSPQFSMWHLISASSFEADDRIRIYLDIDGGTSTVDLLLVTGNSVPNNNSWAQINYDLSPHIGSIVRLVIEFDTDAGGEEMHIDNIQFTEGSINTDCSPDTEDPIISCSSPSPTASVNVCDAAVVVPAPSIFDNCGIASLTNDYNSTSDASDQYPLGSTLVNWTVTDNAGNTATCLIQVNVVGGPSFSPPADLCSDAGIQNNLGGGFPIGGSYSGAGVSDDGNGMTYDFNPQAAGPGDHLITYTFNNGAGCITQACGTISVYEGPASANVQDITVCNGQSTLITPTSSGGNCAGLTELFRESFESDGEDSRYDATLNTIGTPDAYFARVSDGDLNITYNGEGGTGYWAGEDHDHPQVGLGDPSLNINFFSIGNPVTLDVTGQSNLIFKGLFGANPNSFFTANTVEPIGITAPLEPNNYIRVEYQLDGSFWFPILQFSPNVNGPGLALDTDFDGVGDCDILTRDFQEFSVPINLPFSGSELLLRIFMHSDATGEDWAIDEITIAAPAPIPCVFNFYDGDPATGNPNLLAASASSYDPGTTSATSPQSVWVTGVNAAGCESAAQEVVVTVNSISFSALADLCEDAGVQNNLGGGFPTGGMYSGPGVSDDGNGQTYDFDPAAAGPGPHTITYEVLSGGCTGSASDNVVVYATPNISFNVPVLDVCVEDPQQMGLGGGSPSGGVYSGLGVSDNGNGMTFSFNPAASAPGGGNVKVTYAFTDANGCMASASGDIYVNPICCAGPVIDCGAQSSYTQNNDSGACGAQVSIPAVTITEGCGELSISNDYNSGGADASGFYPVGTTTVQFTATDEDGNTDVCNITVTVEDQEDPVVDCTQIVSQRNNDPDDCGFTMLGGGFDPSVSDNCPGVSLSNDFNNSHTLAGAFFAVGSTTVVWTATDAAGRTASCSVTVVVTDQEDPVVEICNGQTLVFNGEDSFPTEDYVQFEASDNCDLGTITFEPNTISCSDIGETIEVLVTVTDVNGNAETCLAYVQVAGLPCGFSTDPNNINCGQGSASYDADDDSFTLQATSCYNTPPYLFDRAAFVKTELCGNGEIYVKVDQLIGLGWAGISMRENSAAGSKKIAISYNGSNFIRREVRYQTNGPAYPQQFPGFGKRWLRLVRSGNQFAGYISSNGSFWQLIMAANIQMPNCIEAGMFLSNHSFIGTVQAVFSNVTVSGGNQNLVAPAAGALQTDFSATPQVTVYPNPARDRFSVELSGFGASVTDLRLTDAQGRTVLQSALGEIEHRTENLDVSHLPPGMYWLRITPQGSDPIIKRLVLQQ